MIPPLLKSVVEAQNLGRRQGLRWTLKNLQLTVQAGERVMVVGSNGSGKTTLLRLISQAWLPSAGKLRLFGGVSGPEAAARCALVSHADYLYDDLSARQNMQLLARLGGGKGLDPLEILKEVGLEGRIDEPVRAFSAGMRKRLSLARLLWKRPDLVLLDEPYGQLDPKGAQMIDMLFRRLAAEGTTLMVATHQVARVAPFCERAVILEGGRLIWEGPSAEAPARMLPAGEDA